MNNGHVRQNWNQCQASPASANRSLWLAVIYQAIEDFRHGVSLNKRDLQNGRWFHSSDFDFICELAKVSPWQVRKANGIL